MDKRFPLVVKAKKKPKLRSLCSLCNESCRDSDERVRHYSSAVHRHMKRIKQKQHSYTKSQKTLEEKIQASEEYDEPLIGLEYIHQYAADRRGVIPYVCTLCDGVYKLDTIFLHIVGIKHRIKYLGKHFPALGINCNYKTRTIADYVKLLNAAEVIEKCHGRQKINVSNSIFNPRKNGGMPCDSDSGREGLTSSEGEQDDACDFDFRRDPSARSEDLDLRSVDALDQVGVRGQNHPPNFSADLDLDLRVNRDDVAPGYDDWSEERDFDFRGDQGDVGMLRQAADRTLNRPPGFFGDRHFQSHMQEGEMESQYDDGGGYPGHQLRENDFAPPHARMPGGPHGDPDMPPVGPPRRGIPPPGFTGNHDHGNPMRRDEPGFPYDNRHGPMFQGGPRPNDHQNRESRDFAFPHDQSAGFMGNAHGDRPMPSMGPSHPPAGFSGGRNFNSRMHRDGMAFNYDDESVGAGHTGERTYGHDQRRMGNAHGDFDMPAMRPPHDQGGYDHHQGFPGDQGDLDAPPFYPQGDPQMFEEQGGAENRHPGIGFQMRGELISFRELKAAHEAGVSLGHGGVDDEGATYDSDMEVRSMDLSDGDPDDFMCNTELFQFVRAFHIQSYEDEQFAMRVRDVFADHSVRYKRFKEETLRRRIAEEKEKLEEEKKAFFEIQLSKAHPKRSKYTDRKSRWGPEPFQNPSEMHPGEWTNQPPETADFVPPKRRKKGKKKGPPRFPPQPDSMTY